MYLIYYILDKGIFVLMLKTSRQEHGKFLNAKTKQQAEFWLDWNQPVWAVF